MKNKTLIIAISLIAVIRYAYADDLADYLSDVKFKSAKAKIAQKKYNDAVKKALEEISGCFSHNADVNALLLQKWLKNRFRNSRRQKKWILNLQVRPSKKAG